MGRTYGIGPRFVKGESTDLDLFPTFEPAGIGSTYAKGRSCIGMRAWQISSDGGTFVPVSRRSGDGVMVVVGIQDEVGSEITYSNTVMVLLK